MAGRVGKIKFLIINIFLWIKTALNLWILWIFMFFFGFYLHSFKFRAPYRSASGALFLSAYVDAAQAHVFSPRARGPGGSRQCDSRVEERRSVFRSGTTGEKGKPWVREWAGVFLCVLCVGEASTAYISGTLHPFRFVVDSLTGGEVSRRAKSSLRPLHRGRDLARSSDVEPW